MSKSNKNFASDFICDDNFEAKVLYKDWTEEVRIVVNA